MPPEDYNPTVMEHFLNPRNTGELKEATAVGTVQNPACGDMIKLSLLIEDGVIRDARARTFGCAAAIASSSVLTEMIKGRTVEATAKAGRGLHERRHHPRPPCFLAGRSS